MERKSRQAFRQQARIYLSDTNPATRIFKYHKFIAIAKKEDKSIVRTQVGCAIFRSLFKTVFSLQFVLLTATCRHTRSQHELAMQL
jgi:hypothetical protein